MMEERGDPATADSNNETESLAGSEHDPNNVETTDESESIGDGRDHDDEPSKTIKSHHSNQQYLSNFESLVRFSFLRPSSLRSEPLPLIRRNNKDAETGEKNVVSPSPTSRPARRATFSSLIKLYTQIFIVFQSTARIVDHFWSGLDDLPALSVSSPSLSSSSATTAGEDNHSHHDYSQDATIFDVLSFLSLNKVSTDTLQEVHSECMSDLCDLVYSSSLFLRDVSCHAPTNKLSSSSPRKVGTDSTTIPTEEEEATTWFNTTRLIQGTIMDSAFMDMTNTNIEDDVTKESNDNIAATNIHNTTNWWNSRGNKQDDDDVMDLLYQQQSLLIPFPSSCERAVKLTIGVSPSQLHYDNLLDLSELPKVAEAVTPKARTTHFWSAVMHRFRQRRKHRSNQFRPFLTLTNNCSVVIDAGPLLRISILSTGWDMDEESRAYKVTPDSKLFGSFHYDLLTPVPKDYTTKYDDDDDEYGTTNTLSPSAAPETHDDDFHNNNASRIQSSSSSSSSSVEIHNVFQHMFCPAYEMDPAMYDYLLKFYVVFLHYRRFIFGLIFFLTTITLEVCKILYFWILAASLTFVPSLGLWYFLWPLLTSFSWFCEKGLTVLKMIKDHAIGRQNMPTNHPLADLMNRSTDATTTTTTTDPVATGTKSTPSVSSNTKVTLRLFWSGMILLTMIVLSTAHSVRQFHGTVRPLLPHLLPFIMAMTSILNYGDVYGFVYWMFLIGISHPVFSSRLPEYMGSKYIENTSLDEQCQPFVIWLFSKLGFGDILPITIYSVLLMIHLQSLTNHDKEVSQTAPRKDSGEEDHDVDSQDDDGEGGEGGETETETEDVHNSD